MANTTKACTAFAEEAPRARPLKKYKSSRSSDDFRERLSLGYDEIIELDTERKTIGNKGLQRSSGGFFGSGGATRDVLRMPLFWGSLAIYAVAAWFLPSHAPALGSAVVGVLGGYISFAALFLNNQAYNRYFESYGACCACQGRIFDAVTLASAGLRPEAAAAVARYCCAAFLAAFVGLSPEHYSVEVLASFVTKHDLLTTAEWDALVAAGGFEGTGDRYRALIAWALRLVADERDAGRCHANDAWLLDSNLLELRAKLAKNYDLIGRPVPFVYVHLVRVLTEIFVPVFAFALTRISRAPSDHALAVVAIVVTNFFFLAINITTKKLADPYGHDLDDIHILSLCKLMPGACARILETSAPPRRADSAETTTTFVRSN